VAQTGWEEVADYALSWAEQQLEIRLSAPTSN
jgi:hypothetical protein